jgi:translation initiation factor 1
MKNNLFEMGSQWESDTWSSDNKNRSTPSTSKILHPDKHELYFRREKRKGKVITLVGEFCMNEKNAKELLKRLKKKLSVGGSIKEGWMEFQGEHEEKLRILLTQESYRFKPKKK